MSGGGRAVRERKRRRVYEIRADYLAGVLAKAVRIFKEQNPGVGRAHFICHDGSTVDIRIHDESGLQARCTKLTVRRATPTPGQTPGGGDRG